MTAVPFTAGPWKAERKHVIAGPFTYKPHWPGVESSAQMEANAKAIAALPALVEALVAARQAVAGLDAEALGMGSQVVDFHDGREEPYPLRDELLSNMDAALKQAGIEPDLGFVDRSEGGHGRESIKKSHRAEGRNFVD